MDIKTTIAIAAGSSIVGFVVGALVMNKTIGFVFETKKPLIVSIIADIVEKGLDDDLRGDDLKEYVNEQINFMKIALRS